MDTFDKLILCYGLFSYLFEFGLLMVSTPTKKHTNWWNILVAPVMLPIKLAIILTLIAEK